MDETSNQTQTMTPACPEPENNSESLAGGFKQAKSLANALLAENELLRPLKTEIATLRSRMADLFYLNSEKDLGIKDAQAELDRSQTDGA